MATNSMGDEIDRRRVLASRASTGNGDHCETLAENRMKRRGKGGLDDEVAEAGWHAILAPSCFIAWMPSPIPRIETNSPCLALTRASAFAGSALHSLDIYHSLLLGPRCGRSPLPEGHPARQRATPPPSARMVGLACQPEAIDLLADTAAPSHAAQTGGDLQVLANAELRQTAAHAPCPQNIKGLLSNMHIDVIPSGLPRLRGFPSGDRTCPW